MKKAFLITLIGFFGMLSNSYAAADTALFRIQSLQDTVDAGDTIDVDLFIGDDNHLADSIKEFEIEIEYDLDVCDKNNISFKLDSAALGAFFGTTFSDVEIINTSNGHVNIKVNCNTIGRGTARIGRIKYIVQDNVNGRQLLKFDFFKISAKRMSGGGGNDKPVKMIGDSLLIIKGYRQQVSTSVQNHSTDRMRIFPNPVADFLKIEGRQLQQYQLINMNGEVMIAGNNGSSQERLMINTNELTAGKYILILQAGNEWKSYPVLKQ